MCSPLVQMCKQSRPSNSQNLLQVRPGLGWLLASVAASGARVRVSALHLRPTPSVMCLALREQKRFSSLPGELPPTWLSAASEHVFAGAPALIRDLIKLLKAQRASRTYANPPSHRPLRRLRLHLQKQIIESLKKRQCSERLDGNPTVAKQRLDASLLNNTR